MSQDFTVAKKVKETQNGTTITVDIKKASTNTTTISGDIGDVIEKLKAQLENKEKK